MSPTAITVGDAALRAFDTPSASAIVVVVSDERNTSPATHAPTPRIIRRARRLPAPSSLEDAWLSRVARALDRAAARKAGLAARLRWLCESTRLLDDGFERRGSQLSQLVRDRALALTRREEDLFEKELLPELGAAGMRIVSWDDLAPSIQRAFGSVFRERFFPALTPVVIDPAHPFPPLPSGELGIAIVLADATQQLFFASVGVPRFLPRLVAVPGQDGGYLRVEELISAHVSQLFPGMQIESQAAFRITRGLQTSSGAPSSHAADGTPVRLECHRDMAPAALEYLMAELALQDAAVYLKRTPLGLDVLLDALREVGTEATPTR